MKNYKVLGIVNIVLIVYIMTLSVGYAFFSEALTIDGVASTVDFYSGNSLPVSAVLRNSANNVYFTSDIDLLPLNAYKSEEWQGDTYTLNIDKSVLTDYVGKDIIYTISFDNPTVLDYTNGKIKTEIVGENSDIVEASAELSSLVVSPNGVVDTSVTIRTKEFTNEKTSVKVTISYTFQNKEKYLYLIINYLPADM